MADVGDTDSLREMGEVQSAARKLGLEVALLEIRQPGDISPAFDKLNSQADALYVVGAPLTTANQQRISHLALTERLPMMSISREFVEASALMSYGANVPDMFRRAADFVDKILRGAKPGDIPVEQPTKFDLVVNLKTAKALGIAVPQSMLVAADEVIE
jgi:putative ABC transport system substrate-binding protein